MCLPDAQTNHLALISSRVGHRANVSLVPDAPTGSNEVTELETSAEPMPRQRDAPEFAANCFANIVDMPLED